MQKRNDINGSLSIGQTLLIGWVHVDGVRYRSERYPGMSPSAWAANILNKETYSQNYIDKVENTQSGIAFWKTANSHSSEGLYALHRTLPSGSIVRIQNPMTNRVLYVKVVGKIPEKAYADNIVVVISPTTARGLGAIDARFYAKVSYLK